MVLCLSAYASAACAWTPRDWVEQLVSIVDRGTQRRPGHGQGDLPGDSRFSQLCLRKLYVLCSRGADASAAQGCILQVGPVQGSLP